MRALLTASCCLLAVGCGKPSAERPVAVEEMAAQPERRAEPPSALRRWAILSSPKVRETGLADLLTAALSQRPSFELVEREQLAAATREQELDHLLGSKVGQRLQLGQVLRADALIILKEASEEPGLVRVVISECRTGARLGAFLVRNPDKDLAKVAAGLAGQVAEIQGRFPAGVRHVVGLTPFKNHNLVHIYDHLQAAYTATLENALLTVPGLAVIETEEARLLADERPPEESSDRLVPVFVEGEFEVSRTNGPELHVGFEIRLAHHSKPAVLIERRGVPMSAVADFLAKELTDAVLANAAVERRAPIPLDQQYARLIARADAFAEVGAWELSTRLRECGSLLQPNNAPQLLQLLAEYQRLARRSTPSPAAAAERWCLERLADTRRALVHLERLIRMRQVTLAQGTRLFEEVLSSLWLVHRQMPPANQVEHFQEFEEDKRSFLRRAYPLLLQLEPGPAPPAQVFAPYGAWQGLLYGAAVRRQCVRVDYVANRGGTHPAGQDMTKEDLDFLLELAIQVVPDVDVWPDGTRPGGALLGFLRDWSFQPEKAGVKFSEAEYLAFLQRLKDSRKPLDRLSARYGLLWHQWRKAQPAERPTLALMAEREQLDKEWLALLTTESSKRSAAAGFQRLNQEIGIVAPTPQVENRPALRQTHPAYEPLDIKVKDLAGTTGPLPGKTWPQAGRNPSGRLVRCQDGLDVYWTGGAVLLHRTRGLFEEVLVDAEADFQDVVWDGKHVWVASGRKGLWVLAPSGQVVARIGAEQELPPGDRGLRLHPVAPGKVCAVGSFGEFGRGWCALVELENRKVKVFHEAKQVWSGNAGDNGAECTWVFEPAHLTGVPDEQDILVVWRRAIAPKLPNGAFRSFAQVQVAQPLQIDTRTLAVSLRKLNNDLRVAGGNRDTYPVFLSGGEAF